MCLRKIVKLICISKNKFGSSESGGWAESQGIQSKEDGSVAVNEAPAALIPSVCF